MWWTAPAPASKSRRVSDAAEKVIVRNLLRRSQVMAFFEALAPCLIGMERPVPRRTIGHAS
jgi:hypothetical protein